MKFKVGVVQLLPSEDKQASCERAADMIRDAAQNGANLILLPEIFYGPYEMDRFVNLAEPPRGPTITGIQNVARQLQVYICAGSIVERQQSSGLLYNTSYLIGPSGKILLRYTKSHLFDVNFEDLKAQESAVLAPGDSGLKVVSTPLGTLGILICYDIRFPEMSRNLAIAGCDILLVPAAFNHVTGPLHWDILFRARAIENQMYVCVASPARSAISSYKAYGHSMIVDPMGRKLAECGEDEESIVADVDSQELTNARGRMPLMSHRRSDLCTVPGEVTASP